MKEKTIQELIKDNHSLAAALHFLGIHFENYTEHTLEDICTERGWNVDKIAMKIKELLTTNATTLQFNSLPIDLLIEYLKHNHFIFIKQRLPFITELIKNFEGDDPAIKAELKLVFPLFVEEFVEHIYEEEDTLFNYILLLNQADRNKAALNKVQARMLENSIKHFQSDHELHDDPFKGLRKLTNNFDIDDRFDLKTKVALSELKKLDNELHYHAKVENDILFPKAIELERKVLALLRSKISMN